MRLSRRTGSSAARDVMFPPRPLVTPALVWVCGVKISISGGRVITDRGNTGADPLDMVDLRRLMARTVGRRATRVGLIDGPLATDHPDFSDAIIELVPSRNTPATACAPGPASDAAVHASSVAGVLVTRRGSSAPAICPGVTLVVRPVLPSATSAHPGTAGADDLACAIVEATDAGTHILNMSLALSAHSHHHHQALRDALDHAFRHGVIIVAAAGNEATIGSTVITRHPAVVPVIAYDLKGNPARLSNLGHSIGRHGVGATGEGMVSVGPEGMRTFGGTSAATAVVTGALALMWSEFPEAGPADVVSAVIRPASRQVSVVAPLLKAWGAYETLRAARSVPGGTSG
ncbi:MULTISPECIES: S8 family serine peptidase [unclassified Streptomyces]|uniref:S8 family serine peptidase n=1 Tax=unclassified Streptomyces TaxID=2593676 RepID=UPI0035DCFFD8